MKKILAGIFITTLTVFLAGCSLTNNSSGSSSGSTTPTIQMTAQNSKKESDKIYLQASFAIFTNGTFRDFSSAMYHNRSTDAFIESTNPNVVRVMKKGTTWNNFFSTLPSLFKLTKDCLTTGTGQNFCNGKNGSLKFYLNGVKNGNLLDLEIKDGDKALITFGDENEMQIKRQLEQIPNPQPSTK